jgi:hypothetical protein
MGIAFHFIQERKRASECDNMGYFLSKSPSKNLFTQSDCIYNLKTLKQN